MIEEHELERIRRVIPKDIQDRIVKFEKSLKEPNGSYVDCEELDQALYDLICYFEGVING